MTEEPANELHMLPRPTFLSIERVMCDYAREHALPNGVDVPRFGIAARHAFATWGPE